MCNNVVCCNGFHTCLRTLFTTDTELSLYSIGAAILFLCHLYIETHYRSSLIHVSTHPHSLPSIHICTQPYAPPPPSPPLYITHMHPLPLPYLYIIHTHWHAPTCTHTHNSTDGHLYMYTCTCMYLWYHSHDEGEIC